MGFNNGLIKIKVSTINFLIFIYFYKLPNLNSTNFSGYTVFDIPINDWCIVFSRKAVYCVT